jgi:hypothetical protein
VAIGGGGSSIDGTSTPGEYPQVVLETASFFSQFPRSQIHLIYKNEFNPWNLFRLNSELRTDDDDMASSIVEGPAGGLTFLKMWAFEW